MAGFWWPQVAFTQDKPASQRQEGAGLPSAEGMSRTTPWDTIQWVERRYKIEAVRFKARDETGIDWLGSDEVIIQTNDAKGSTVSNEIGDIDSGDTHSFDPAISCVVAVRPGVAVLGESSVCEEIGEPAPMFFRVEFWEKDFFLPAGFCIPTTPRPGEHGGPHCANDGTGDDFIGNARIDYSTQELEAALPNVGNDLIETVALDPCPGEICAGFPDYTFTWRITRLPDAQVNLGVLANEAMQRTGARSELEAIAAGLRALRAPNPKKIKPDTAR
ncbi:MAG: hypothetical protein WD623_08040 [Marinobacter sp.]|uniref:hypothetical protein n=1 Tax=Marinobacter sp. TaxID=50741 RepID=UPI00349FFB0C